ncbi:MAG: glycosyltransferase family 39 protein, partial [Pedosphaera parvula]|nr:glycosyltransferase family 39 protein [Pedosphaera parvula]
MTDDAPRPAPVRRGLFLGLVVLALYVIRLAAPSDLIDYGQEANTAYVLDAVGNGHWIVQRDLYGAVTSKPPLYTWLASSVSVALGRIDRFTLSLPAALATLALTLVIFAAGRAHFGWHAGFLGALAYACSGIAAKQVALVRTDGLFALSVTVLALLAFRAWQKGSGWTWVWLAAALSTLTKGPLGLLLAATGLLAAFWERPAGQAVPLRGSHVAGVGLFLLVAGGWFAWAFVVLGQDLI